MTDSQYRNEMIKTLFVHKCFTAHFMTFLRDFLTSNILCKVKDWRIFSEVCNVQLQKYIHNRTNTPPPHPPTHGGHFCLRPTTPRKFRDFPTYLGTPCMKKIFPSKMPLYYTFMRKIIVSEIKSDKISDTTTLIPFLANALV